MKQALLIIDVQNDYFKNGKFPLVNPENALNHVLILQQIFQQQNKLIIYIQHINDIPTANFFANDSEGANIHSLLLANKKANELVIIKHYPNSFKDTELQLRLQQAGIEELVICGMMTHMCVDSTTRCAVELGYPSMLIADACATRDLVFGNEIIKAHQVQGAFLSALSSFSRVISCAQFESYYLTDISDE